MVYPDTVNSKERLNEIILGDFWGLILKFS